MRDKRQGTERERQRRTEKGYEGESKGTRGMEIRGRESFLFYLQYYV